MAPKKAGRSSKQDLSALKSLPSKKQRYLRKLVNRLSKLGTDDVLLPIDHPITEVIILYKGNSPSWIHDTTTDDCKLLIRVESMDEEGLGCHLTEDAKVFQWILWQPLLGENSKAHPERCWREDNFPTPGEFMASKIHGKFRHEIRKICADRWDTSMMLGGADNVSELIDKHIRADNLNLRTCIMTWMKGIKWHQDWDWESITEAALFMKGHGFDVYWESDDYDIPSTFKPLTIWSSEHPDVLANLKRELAVLPSVLGGAGSKSSSITPGPELSPECTSLSSGLTQTTLTHFAGSTSKPANAGKSRKKHSKKGRSSAAESIRDYLKSPIQPLKRHHPRKRSRFTGGGESSSNSRKRSLSSQRRRPTKAKKPKSRAGRSRSRSSSRKRSKSSRSSRSGRRRSSSSGRSRTRSSSRSKSRSKRSKRKSKTSRRKRKSRSKSSRRKSKSRKKSSRRSRKKTSKKKSRRRTSSRKRSKVKARRRSSKKSKSRKKSSRRSKKKTSKKKKSRRRTSSRKRSKVKARRRSKKSA